MKPTSFLPATTRHAAEDSGVAGARFPQTDFHFQTGQLLELGPRVGGSVRPSFHGISREYFAHEARGNFRGELAFFAVIVLTSALPVLEAASGLVHFLRTVSAI